MKHGLVDNTEDLPNSLEDTDQNIIAQNEGRPAEIQKRPFVHNSVCSQFLEGLFALLDECSQFCLRPF